MTTYTIIDRITDDEYDVNAADHDAARDLLRVVLFHHIDMGWVAGGTDDAYLHGDIVDYVTPAGWRADAEVHGDAVMTITE